MRIAIDAKLTRRSDGLPFEDRTTVPVWVATLAIVRYRREGAKAAHIIQT